MFCRKLLLLLFLPVIAYASGHDEFGYTLNYYGDVSIYSYKGSDTEVTIPATINNRPVTALSGTFEGDENITKVFLPDSITHIGDYTFSGCTNLESIEIPSGAKNIGVASFYDCKNLKRITIPEGAKVGNYAFNGCTNLEYVTLLSYSWWTLGSYAFSNCDFLVLELRGVIYDLPTGDLIEGTQVAAYHYETGDFFSNRSDVKHAQKIVSPDDISYGNGFVYTVDDGEVNIEFYYGDRENYGNEKDVIIPSMIGDGVVTNIDSRAFSDTSVTSVTIPQGINIDEYAFSDNQSLQRVVFSEATSDLIQPVSIGAYAFQDCTALNELVFSDGPLAFDSDAFSGCVSLEEIELPDSLTELPYGLFRNCTSLNRVVIPNSILNIGSFAFLNCSALDNLNIPDSVISIDRYAFESCLSLDDLFIPDSVTSIGEYAFKSCENLASISLSGSIESLSEGLFYACSSLEQIDIPNSVTSINSFAFEGCSSLVEVDIPESVSLYGDDIFADCTSLEYVYFPSQIDRIPSGVFKGCTSMTEYVVPESVSHISNDAFYGCTSLSSVRFLHEEESLLYLQNDAFYGCTSLRSLMIPCEVSLSSSVFEACSNLSYVEFYGPASYASSSAFDDTGAVAIVHSYYLSSYSNTWDIITVDSWDKIMHADGFISLEGRSTLELMRYYGDASELIIPSYIEGKKVTSIAERAFAGITNLTEVVIPDTVTEIDEKAFYNCTNLRDIELSGSLTDLSDRMFYNCNSLSSIKLPRGVTRIGMRVFEECRSLSKVVIPNTVTEIDDYAFYNCTSLKELTIPSGVTSIGSSVFICDTKVSRHITFAGDMPDMSSINYMGFGTNAYLSIYYYSDRWGFDTLRWKEFSMLELEPYIWRDAEENDAGNVLTSDWYGWFYIDDYPLIYHPKHGYQYCYEDTADSLYLWDYATKTWFWTHRDFYPWVYIFTDEPSYYYFSEDGTAGNRWFNDSRTGEWVFETNI